MNKGQLSLIGMVIGGVFALSASVVTAWATASSRVAEIDTQVQLVEQRQELQYREVIEKLDLINRKLDRL